MIFDPHEQEWIVPVKDWRAEIAHVRRKRHPVFSHSDKVCASMWNRCKIGEEHAKLPEIVIYREIRRLSTSKLRVFGPVDDELDRLGTDFWAAIGEDDVDEAERLVDAIEDRVAELKRNVIT